MPVPATAASRQSRARRARARERAARREIVELERAAAASATQQEQQPVVTTSTAICVSARSGAENQANVRQVTRPAPPTMISAASRWNFACIAAPIAHAAPTTHSSANDGIERRELGGRGQRHAAQRGRTGGRDALRTRSAAAASAGGARNKRTQTIARARDQADDDDVENRACRRPRRATGAGRNRPSLRRYRTQYRARRRPRARARSSAAAP